MVGVGKIALGVAGGIGIVIVVLFVIGSSMELGPGGYTSDESEIKQCLYESEANCQYCLVKLRQEAGSGIGSTAVKEKISEAFAKCGIP